MLTVRLQKTVMFDLLVIKDTVTPWHRRPREIRKYLRGIKVPMDILVYNRKEIERWENVRSAFITQVIEKGKVVYER